MGKFARSGNRRFLPINTSLELDGPRRKRLRPFTTPNVFFRALRLFWELERRGRLYKPAQ